MLRVLKQIALTGLLDEPLPPAGDEWRVREALQSEIARVFDRAVNIREVDAGSCNGCELEIAALENPYYNLQGAGIKFVASPRHADLLLVTGPVSRHMAEALRRTYDATPDPKRVVAVGDCAACGGIFGEGYATVGSVSKIIPVDVVVPGCPPAPVALLRGILAAVRGGRSGRSDQ